MSAVQKMKLLTQDVPAKKRPISAEIGPAIHCWRLIPCSLSLRGLIVTSEIVDWSDLWEGFRDRSRMSSLLLTIG